MAGIRIFSLPKRHPNVLGAYGFSVVPVTVAAPGAGTLQASLRWTSTSRLMVVRKIALRHFLQVASGSNFPELAVFVARSFTAPDTGGTAPALTGDNLKKRTSYPTTALADLRFAAGAAMTPGTRTLDSAPVLATISNTVIGSVNPPGVTELDYGADPLIIGPNEGLVLNNVLAMTTAVVKMEWRVEWLEIDAGAEL